MALRHDLQRGLRMEPAWHEDQPTDPNWSRGAYHGMRMRPGGSQAAYGYHRLTREPDLLAHGGFHGLYGQGPGEYDRAGAFRHPGVEALRHRAQPRLLPRSAAEAELADPARVEDGGVRADNRYLRQYNAESPMLRDGREGELGYGHAPAGGRDGELADPGVRERPTDERGYAGYDPAGIAPEVQPGVDPRK